MSTPRKIFVVTQYGENEGLTGIEGVYGTRALAEAAVAAAKAILVEDEMDESYYYEIDISFFIEE